MSRAFSALLSVLGAVLLSASHANAQVLCKFDAECGLGEVCASGICVPTAQTGSAACATGRCGPPGQATDTHGDQNATGTASMDLPPEPSEEDQRDWERNTTLIALGAVSVGVGTIAFVVGGITKVLSKDENTVQCEDAHCRSVTHHERIRLNTVGWIGLVGGGVLLAGGIPLIIIGSKKHPVDKPVPSVTLEAVVGPTSGRLVLEF